MKKKARTKYKIFSVRHIDEDLIRRFTLICEMKDTTIREQMEKILIEFVKKEAAVAYENAGQFLRVGS